jgi:hypothetical protein
MEETKKVEATDTTIKNVDGGNIVPAPEQEDTLALLKAKEEEIEKLRKEKNDFFVGMNKYKKLAKTNRTTSVDEEDEDSPEDKMRQIAAEVLLNSEIGKKEAEHRAFIEKIALENSELKRAMQNKSQISNLPGGSSQESITGGDVIKKDWTPEQLEYFKAVERNLPPGIKIDPAKVMENYKKYNNK